MGVAQAKRELKKARGKAEALRIQIEQLQREAVRAKGRLILGNHEISTADDNIRSIIALSALSPFALQLQRQHEQIQAGAEFLPPACDWGPGVLRRISFMDPESHR